MKCPHCQQENVVKNGKSLHGRQRWQCGDCQRTFGESDQRRHSESTKQQALRLYLEGVGFRGIERLLGVSHVAVMHWVKAKAKAQPAPPPVRAEEVEWVECDELCTFIGKKKDFCWLWWAIDRASKTLCGWALGDRSTATARQLFGQLPCGAGLTYCTDHSAPYAEIFENHPHLQGKAHTFTIESWNARLRHYLARLHRKTHCYSKSRDMLRWSIQLFLAEKCLSTSI